MSAEEIKLALDGGGLYEITGRIEDIDKCIVHRSVLVRLLENHIPDATKMVSGVKDSLTTQEEQGGWHTHDLYTDEDKDRPDVICDINGQVALGLCKRCGRGEAQLETPCDKPKHCEYCKRGLKTMCLCGLNPKQEQGKPVAWQERQAKRMTDGVVTEWTNWYPCPYRTIDEAQAEACDHIPYEWRPLYTTPQPKQEQGEPVAHWSDCAVHSEPAYPAGECDCGGYSPDKELLDSARAFYNATVADLQVRISSSSQEKRDVAFKASERLRIALLTKLKATDEDLKVYQAIADNYFKDTTPQQRTWVGLTLEERDHLWEVSRAGLPRYNTFAGLVEAKLKEKNT